MKGKMLITFLLILNVVVISAQSRHISVVVKDLRGYPLIGVSALVEGTTNGVVMDLDGKFKSDNVANISTLIFSYIGIISQKIKVGKSNINVSLKDDIKALNEEVIVNSYGTSTKRKLVGFVSSLGSDKIKNTTFL